MRIVYQLPPIGDGGFGRVYAACILEKSESRVIALKKTRHSDYVEHPPLLHEACGLVLADEHPSIPQVFGWGRSQYYEYLATELLDCNLITKFKHTLLTRRNFVSLVLQMFAAVEHIHSRGILHCDIKPDNFLFGTGRNSGRIYLIDFNLWAPWCTWNKDLEEFEPIGKADAARGFRGTFRYASINCHLDRERTIWNLWAYTIFELYASRLPWSRISNEEPNEIATAKQVWKVPGLLQGSCDYPLGHFADYARSLKFDTEPDYKHWRREFWTVDNPTAPIPELDPLCDPDDTTEILPRNMKFITKGPGGGVIKCKLPAKPNTGRMYPALSSDHTWIPVSDGWERPHTMLGIDTLEDELRIVRQYVEPITEPPTTMRPYLDSGCHPEEMRGINDPLPFKRPDERNEEKERVVMKHLVTDGEEVGKPGETRVVVEGPTSSLREETEEGLKVKGQVVEREKKQVSEEREGDYK